MRDMVFRFFVLFFLLRVFSLLFPFSRLLHRGKLRLSQRRQSRRKGNCRGTEERETRGSNALLWLEGRVD